VCGDFEDEGTYQVGRVSRAENINPNAANWFGA